jgi:uncharacterized protein YdhG (YjbR/CyaY superfamily)
MTTDPRFEGYLASRPPEQQRLLRDLRDRVRTIVPSALDAISYGMPALTVDGKALLWFAAWKRHCSVYPVGPGFIAAHPGLADHGHTDKGALHFSTDRPLPAAVIDDLVRERLAALSSEREA